MTLSKYTTRCAPRGNTLILVIGILVLLVLIAIMFVVKSQSIRITASAQREAARINEQARTIGRSVASEIAIQLFPSELVPMDDTSEPSSANSRRKAPLTDAIRYGHDRNAPFNFAPYDVIPWTNPPDLEAVDPSLPPIAGPANPKGGPSIGDSRWLRDTEPQRADLFDLSGKSDIYDQLQDGTPETFTHWRHLTNISRSDNAWRIVPDVSYDPTGQPPPPILSNLDLPFEQWPTFRPQIGDGLIIPDLGYYPSLVYEEGNVQYDGSMHHARMMQWMNPESWESWSAMQYDPFALPQNFLDLSDLDGDGIHNEIGERYIDAFVRGTDRWWVERSMTDTDGDGFTDAFWHLSPLPSSSDTRQIVAISITDNSALLNANVATKFIASVDDVETRGHTPADLALIGTNLLDDAGRVGFFDSYANLPGNAKFSDDWVEYDHTRWDPLVDWNTDQWDEKSQSSFLDELGIEKGLGLSDFDDANPIFDDNQVYNPTSHIRSQYGRLWYWQLAGRDPFNATEGFRPFTLADELELRYYHGNNAQAISSRFEVAVNNPQEQTSGDFVENQFLRSSVLNAHESSELRDQLDNKQLLFDNRRKLTLFNGVRNDLLPPWLRWEERFWNRFDPELVDYENGLELPHGYDTFDSGNYDGIADLTPGETFNVFASAYPIKIAYEAFIAVNSNGIEGLEFVLDNWREQSRSKVDLRAYYADNTDGWWESNSDGLLTFAERAPLQVLLAMTNSQEDGFSNLQGGYNKHFENDDGEYTLDSYGPTGTTDVPDAYSLFDWGQMSSSRYHQTRLAAAGLASNMLTYRDTDSHWRQHTGTVGISMNAMNEFSPRSELALSQMVSPPIIGRQDNYVPQELLFVEQHIEGPNSPLPTEGAGADGEDGVGGSVSGGGGACCVDFVCKSIDQSDCYDLGGFYFGAEIECSTDPCKTSVHSLGLESQPFILEAFVAHVHKGKLSEVGACCINGSVCIDISEDTCIALYGGHFAGIGEHCDGDDGIPGTADDACGEQGACCVPNGGCIFVNETACQLLEGEFMGLAVECEDTTCTGACCLDGTDPLGNNESNCQDDYMSSFTCDQLGGTFHGHGTACDDAKVDCTLSGSCCFESGSCFNVLLESNCSSMGGEYHPGEFCFEDPCPLGACCIDQEYGLCIEVTKETCANDLAGTFQIGDTCDADPCDPSGACCFGSGSCVDVMTPTACEDDGGTYYAGAYCNAAPTTITQYPIADSWIQEANPSTPHASNSTLWVGEQGSSNRVHILMDFDIDEATIDNRAVLSATLALHYEQHAGSEPSTVKVARLTEQWTAEATWEKRDVFTGWFGGAAGYGAVLAVSATPAPVSFDVGEVIEGDVQYIDLTEFVTDALKFRDGLLSFAIIKETPDGYNSRTAFSSMEADGSADWPTLLLQLEPSEHPCAASCCLETGLCQDFSETTCYEYGGEYIQGFSCGSFPCSNACCIDGQCLEVSGNTCADLNGANLGVGTFCDPSVPVCGNGACCFSSGSCVEVYSSATCDDMGGYEYVPTTACSDSVCLFLGACCFNMGGCEIISRDSCNMLDGNYLGVGTECGEDNINCGPVGACCLFDGTNRAWVNELRYGLPRLWLNELHYDNEGEDFNEFIEVAIDSALAPSDITVYLYDGEDDDGNGVTGEVYDTLNLSTFTAGQFTGGMVLYSIIHQFDGDFILQNGRSDGLAITFTDEYNVEHVVQFLSYEGSFVATNGPAAGMTAVDLGDRVREEPPPAGINTSIGLSNLDGSQYDDFAWAVFPDGMATPGTVNSTQSIIEPMGGVVHGLIEIAIGNDVLLSLDSEAVEVNVVLYDGENSSMYRTYSLRDDFTEGEEPIDSGMTLFSREFAAGELQDGGIDGDGIAIEILYTDPEVLDVKRVFCYEGVFNPPGYDGDGGAVFQIPLSLQSPQVGSSIGLTGQSSTYRLAADKFIWVHFEDQTAIAAAAQNEGEKITSALGDYGGCMEITEIGCDAIDGIYNGDGISCGTVPCDASDRGACCFFTGGCADIPQLNCNEIGGEWNGVDANGDPVSCADNVELPCQPVGVCCLDSGSCHEVSETICENDLAGDYQGDGLSCSEIECIDPMGACCMPFAVCVDNVSNVTCVIDLGGEYFVDCEDAECTENRGGCCFDSGSCIDVRSEDICEVDLGGTYAGANIFCDSNPCSGSCCLDSGACIDTKNVGDCTIIGGEFLQYTTCASRPCVGACCISRDECRVISKASCAQKLIEGTFQGFGTDCTVGDPCSQGDLGACCVVNAGENFCIDNLGEGSCNTLEGTHYVGLLCANLGLQCPTSGELIGACCLADGQCTMVTSGTECLEFGGKYSGDGTTCAENTCLGGCCLDSGSCIQTDEDNCVDNLGGSYLTSACSSTPCALACCLDSGSCIDVQMKATCEYLGGTAMDFGSRCAADPCGGACCLEPIGCEFVSAPSCVEMGGSFQGAAIPCEEQSCASGSCCLESGSCLETDFEVCVNLAGEFKGGEWCEDNPCLGACCLWAGGCEMLSIDTCESLWDPNEDGRWSVGDEPGYFNGFGEQCDDITLCNPTGSCCMPSGTCVDIISIASDEESSDFFYYCESVIGGSFEPGELCADRECDRACCLPEGGCADTSEMECERRGGLFNPDEMCDSDPCEEGACCFDSGSCNNIVQELCEGDEEEGIQGLGTWSGGSAIPFRRCDEQGIPGVDCTEYFLVTNNKDDCPQETVSVVQLANPFDSDVDLNNFSVEFFGQEVLLSDLEIPNDAKLEPSTYEQPNTLILYSISNAEDTTIKHLTIGGPNDEPHFFDKDWLDFLDILELDGESLHPEHTLVVRVPRDPSGEGASGWSTDRTVYDDRFAGEQNSVAIYRFDAFHDEMLNLDRTQRVLIDRLDVADPDEESVSRFDTRVVDDLEDKWNMLLMDDHPIDHPDHLRSGYITLVDTAGERIPVFNDEGRRTSALFVQWDRATRAWAVDTPNLFEPELGDRWHNDKVDSWEKNPRYVFAAHDLIQSQDESKVTNFDNKDIWGDQFEQMQHTSSFHWSEFEDPDDMDGDGNPDNAVVENTPAGELEGDKEDSSEQLPFDDDLLPDDPDPWFVVEVWSPRAGVQRPFVLAEGEVQGGLRWRKPTYFDLNMHEDPNSPSEPTDNWSFPDKGWYGQKMDLDGDFSASDTAAFEDGKIDGEYQEEFENFYIDFEEIDMALNFPMQMLQKDDDFEQVGELLNCWLFGHLVEGEYYTTLEGDYLRTLPSPLEENPPATTYVDAGTITTFSEFMFPDENDWWAEWVAPIVSGEVVLDARVNRLRFQSQGDNNIPVMLDGRSAIDDFGRVYSLDHPWPRLSVAARVLDSFVCDGPGHPDDLNEDQSYWHSFYNANGFSGKGTPGLININTASVEVLRTLPHMYKMVHPYGGTDEDINPRTMIPEAMVQWREQYAGSFYDEVLQEYIPNVLYDTGSVVGPDYSNRTNATNLRYGYGPKHTRGFSSPAEISMLNKGGIFETLQGVEIAEPWHLPTDHEAIIRQDAWRIDFAALSPYGDSESNNEPIIGASLGTEVSPYDEVSSDSEEQNLLQSGISNLITTSSDVFTVYLRIRTFKRNPIDGSWDATDLDHIVDDSRYVMLVDRSNVNSPSDKPKILYFEKIPN